MDSVNTYAKAIRKILDEYAGIPAANEADICNEVLYDTERHRYLLLSLGWSNGRRIHNTVIHIDIIDEQVWIQSNNTDRLIAEELVELGIPAQAIVLGLQPPEVRPYTAYGLPHPARHSNQIAV